LVKDGQNRWPAQIEDCQAAIRFLRANAEKHKIDPARFGAFGDSAGAHLSMLLGTIDDDTEKSNGDATKPSSKVQAVVGYYGPTDLSREFPDRAAGIVRNFIGGPVAEHKTAYEQASPLTHVNRGDAAMLLFHGTRDELVPHEQAVLMAEKLSAAGVNGRVEILIGLGHGWGGKLADHTERAGFEFFKEVLGLEK
jgi:acetyl esterase/lipase